MLRLILAFDIIIHGIFRSVPLALALGKCGPEAEGCREHGLTWRIWLAIMIPRVCQKFFPAFGILDD